MSETCWEPLEATPNVFNTLANALGVSLWKFVDIVEFASVPSDAVALILMYPTTVPEVDAHLRRPSATFEDSQPNIFFIRQLVGGSCGTIAALHALVNGIANRDIPTSSALHGLLDSAAEENDNEQSVTGRSCLVIENSQIRRAHKIAAAGARTTTASFTGQRQGASFLTFVKSPEGLLWELDGRRENPVCRGKKDAITEVQDILKTAVNVHFGFVLLALVPV